MKKPKFLVKLIHPTNIYEALRPLVLMLFLIGIPPFELSPTVNKKTSKRVYFGRALGLLFLIQFFASFSLTVGRTIFTSIFLNESITQIADSVLVTATMIAMFIVYLSVFMKKYNLKDIVHIIYRVDLRLARLKGVRLRHSRTVVKIFKYSVLSAIFYVIYVSGSYQMIVLFNHDTYLHVWISYFMPHHILMHILFKYLVIVNVIRVRFTINNKVSRAVKNCKGEIYVLKF